ncbi:flagellar type III secretion system pore protein FliP [bacterium]|jgi:flagellar biosynthesis protein FliP|nr:flagellar type III secretion system pore protein FliP [bacterium]
MKRFLSLLLGFAALSVPLWAQEVPINIDFDALTQPIQFSSSIGLLVSLSSISLAPFFLISTTSFVRFAIVLGMIRNAIGTNQSPPNPVIISLAIFMTIYVMSPTWTRVYEEAIQPYNQGTISQGQAFKLGIQPFREFMLKYTREKDLALFIEFSKIPPVQNLQEVPMFVLIPSFLISELKTAFQIGFLLFIPFVVIDLVVSNILLSLGMFMLSPVMISLPFKILLFVLTDGWNLVTRGLLTGFQ